MKERPRASAVKVRCLIFRLSSLFATSFRVFPLLYPRQALHFHSALHSLMGVSPAQGLDGGLLVDRQDDLAPLVQAQGIEVQFDDVLHLGREIRIGTVKPVLSYPSSLLFLAITIIELPALKSLHSRTISEMR